MSSQNPRKALGWALIMEHLKGAGDRLEALIAVISAPLYSSAIYISNTIWEAAGPCKAISPFPENIYGLPKDRLQQTESTKFIIFLPFSTCPGPVGLGLGIYKPGEGSTFPECFLCAQVEAVSLSFCSLSSCLLKFFLVENSFLSFILVTFCASNFSSLRVWFCGGQDLSG